MTVSNMIDTPQLPVHFWIAESTQNSGVAMIVSQDELDIAPAGGSQHRPQPMNTSEEFLAALDKSAADARAALQKTSDAHLQTKWTLLAGGNVVQEQPRFEMIQDTINHWAHHRGQMTVYLRLMDAKVPAIYGPSADDRSFR